MERQYRIGTCIVLLVLSGQPPNTLLVYSVKPDATPEEIRAVVDDDQGGQIFSQAVCSRMPDIVRPALTGSIPAPQLESVR